MITQYIMPIERKLLGCGQQWQALHGRRKEFPDFVYKGEPNKQKARFHPGFFSFSSLCHTASASTQPQHALSRSAAKKGQSLFPGPLTKLLLSSATAQSLSRSNLLKNGRSSSSRSNLLKNGRSSSSLSKKKSSSKRNGLKNGLLTTNRSSSNP